jgi:hypothetical protein
MPIKTKAKQTSKSHNSKTKNKERESNKFLMRMVVGLNQEWDSNSRLFDH